MDPALEELNEAGPADEEVSLILRLQDGAEPPPTVRVVCRFGPIITVRCRRADIRPTWESDRVISAKAPRAVHLPRQIGERRAPADRGEAAATELEVDPEETEVLAEGGLARRQPQPLPALPVDGRGVVVGICDWGLDFTHPSFLNEDGSTRLLALWDQRGTGDPRAPAPYHQGRLFTQEDINAALAQPDPCAALGYHPSSGDPGNTGAHGTHVADIVAGNRRYPGSEVGLASGADLVFVHLGAQHLGELGNLGDSVGLLEGLDFVRRTAAAAGRPCVMHLSAGKTGGPHCAATLVERAVDVLLLESPGVVLVQSVGNYADSAMHTHARIGPDQTHTLDWLIPPDDRTPNELEIWYGGKDVFGVTLVAPDGQEFSAPLGQRARLGDGGAAWGNFYHRLHEPNSGLNHIDIFLYTAAPAGRWKVVVHGQNVVDGRLHAWIERDAGSRYQSRFSRAQATSSYTTNTICNSFRAIAVGAYDANRPERPPARFSSRGPTADGRQKPELSAPGVRILAARSMPRDGWNGERKLVVKSGTSMAAPWVSGTVALMFQAAGRPLTIHEVRRILIGTADSHAGQRGRSSSQLGFGYLNTAAAVEAARLLGGGATAAPPPPPSALSPEPDEARPDEAPPIRSTWIEVPLGEAAVACGCGDKHVEGNPEEGSDLRGGAVLGDEHHFASVVIDDTVEIKATLPSKRMCTLNVYADGVDEHDSMKTTGQLAKLGSQANVSGAVVFRWKATPLGVPVFRLRLEISAGDKLLEKRLSTVVSLFDWVDFTLADPDYVDPLAREGTPRAEVAVDNAKTPTVTVVKQRDAWADAVGVVEEKGKIVGGVRFNDQGKGRSLFPHFAGKSYTARFHPNQIHYADVKKGSSAFDFHPAVTPRTNKDFLLSSRLRLSIWADPALFQTPAANTRKTKPTDPDWVGSGKFTSAAIDAGGDKTAALDDFTMLNVFSLDPKPTLAQQKQTNTKRVTYVGKLDSTFWRQAVQLCHSKNIQVMAGYIDIIKKTLSQSRLLTWLDSAQLTEKEITDFADEIVQFLTADVPWDGVDFDIEHLPKIGSWSVPLRKNIQIFFEYLGRALAESNMLVSIAGTTFIDHTHVQSAWVPATGSGTGLPVTLAHLSPNIVYRAMAYDNAFLGDQLRRFHREVTRFAISPAGDKGAGLHPSGFQLGVKIFPGTNNGPKETYINGEKALQGYMTGMPVELQTTCRSVLRPHRIGLIMFAWGLQKPDHSPGWDTVVKLDEALNSVEPAPIPDPVDKQALDALAGVARFPHAALGQPLQGAFTQESLDRLKK